MAHPSFWPSHINHSPFLRYSQPAICCWRKQSHNWTGRVHINVMVQVSMGFHNYPKGWPSFSHRLTLPLTEVNNFSLLMPPTPLPPTTVSADTLHHTYLRKTQITKSKPPQLLTTHAQAYSICTHSLLLLAYHNGKSVLKPNKSLLGYEFHPMTSLSAPITPQSPEIFLPPHWDILSSLGWLLLNFLNLEFFGRSSWFPSTVFPSIISSVTMATSAIHMLWPLHLYLHFS